MTTRTRRMVSPNVPPMPGRDGNWTAAAACVGHDPELWFAVNPDRVEYATNICGTCPVRERCLTEAVRDGITDGIYGGVNLGVHGKKASKTRCSRGHSWSEHGYEVPGKAHRRCRKCQQMANRNYGIDRRARQDGAAA